MYVVEIWHSSKSITITDYVYYWFEIDIQFIHCYCLLSFTFYLLLFIKDYTVSYFCEGMGGIYRISVNLLIWRRDISNISITITYCCIPFTYCYLLRSAQFPTSARAAEGYIEYLWICWFEVETYPIHALLLLIALYLLLTVVY